MKKKSNQRLAWFLLVLLLLLINFVAVYVPLTVPLRSSGIICQNGGNVTNGTCVCPINYNGTFCEMFNSCDPNPCFNGGLCMDGLCTCLPGYNGTLCENNLPPVPTVGCNCEYSVNGTVLGTAGAAVAMAKDANEMLYAIFYTTFPSMVITKFSPDGVLVGSVPLITPPGNDYVSQFLVLTDGSFACLNSDVNIWKNTIDGLLDTNFPVVTLTFFGQDARIGDRTLHIGLNGSFYHRVRTLMTGTINSNHQQHIEKYISTGLDVTFGNFAGRLTSQFQLLVQANPHTPYIFSDLKVLPNGSLILFGSVRIFTIVDNLNKPVIIKLTPTGVIDTTFGTNGYFFWPDIPIYDGFFNSLGVINPDGSIYVGGTAALNDQYFQIAGVFKLTSQGVLDTTFGVNSLYLTQENPLFYTMLEGMEVESCGNLVLVVAKYILDVGANPVDIFRLNSSGVLNPQYPQSDGIDYNGVYTRSLIITEDPLNLYYRPQNNNIVKHVCEPL